MMEKKILETHQKEIVDEAIVLINQMIALVDQYEPSRQGNFAIMKLEEFVAWFQTMVSNVPKKVQNVNPFGENIVEDVIAE